MGIVEPQDFSEFELCTCNFHICAEVSQLEVDELSSSSPESSLNETHKCSDYQLEVDQAPRFLRVL